VPARLCGLTIRVYVVVYNTFQPACVAAIRRGSNNGLAVVVRCRTGWWHALAALHRTICPGKAAVRGTCTPA
jgi:hypothetical protein